MTNTLPTTRELAKLRPAEVVTRKIVPSHRRPPTRKAEPGQHVETLIGTHAALDRELRMLARNRGRLLGRGERHLIQSGQHAGLLELRVIVKDEKRTPRWAKVCIVLGVVVVGLALLAAALAWLFAAMNAQAMIGFAVVVLVLLFAMTRAAAGGGDRARGVFVQVTTSVHVR